MKHTKRTILSGLLSLALILCTFAPAAMAADASGTIYFTTFNLQPNPGGVGSSNVWSVTFTYTGGVFNLGTITPLAATNGADAIHFSPNSTSQLLITGQDNNNLAEITTTGTILTNVKVDSTGTAPQGFGLTVVPGGASLLIFPNGGAGDTYIDSVPYPLADGTNHAITGDDQHLRSVAYDPNGNAYYGTANDFQTGNFGLLNTSTFATTQLKVVDDTAGGASPCPNNVNGQGCLPSHSLEYDSCTGNIFIGDGHDIWQIDVSDVGTGTVHIISKYHNTTNSGSMSVDQTSTDGNCRMFVADAGTGHLLYLDYSATGKIGDAGVQKYDAFLISTLDDVANGGGVINNLTLSCPASTGTVGVPYSSSLVATGGTTPYTFSLDSGSFPNGLGFASTPSHDGLITGTPTNAGTFSFQALVTDSTSGTALTKTADCQIVISPSGGTGCPATQGFWHKTARWPNVTVTIDGVTYNGATDHSMVIGGITYTQVQLDAILPSGSLHTGGYVNAISQMIAAVLNLAAGAQTGTPDLIDPAITSMNNALNGVHFVSGNPPVLVSISPSLKATLMGFLTTLDNYNNAVGMNCTEGSGLTLGTN